MYGLANRPFLILAILLLPYAINTPLPIHPLPNGSRLPSPSISVLRPAGSIPNPSSSPSSHPHTSE